MEHKKQFKLSIEHAGAGRINRGDIERAINRALAQYMTGTIEVVELEEVYEAQIMSEGGGEMIDALLCIPKTDEIGQAMMKRLIDHLQSRPRCGSTTGTSERRHGRRKKELMTESQGPAK